MYRTGSGASSQTIEVRSDFDMDRNDDRLPDYGGERSGSDNYEQYDFEA